MARIPVALGVAGTWVAGCTGAPVDDGGCLGVATEVGPVQDPGDLGFSVEDVQAQLLGDHAATLLWTDGTSSTLTLGVAERGKGVWMEADPSEAGNPACPDPYFLVPFAGTVVTADGKLDTEWAFDQQVGALGVYSLRAEFVQDALRGSWTPLALTLDVVATWDDAAEALLLSGSLTEWVEVEGSGGVQSPRSAAAIGL